MKKNEKYPENIFEKKNDRINVWKKLKIIKTADIWINKKRKKNRKKMWLFNRNNNKKLNKILQNSEEKNVS